MSAQGMKVAGCFLMIAMSSGTVIPPCNAAQLKPSDEASSATSDFSGAVDIGNGRKLHLECSGAGFPTVILESGLRTRGDNWSRTDLLSHGGAPVLQEAAKFVRVCTYDRPGTTLNPGEVSRSDAAPMPRTALNVVHDLHALLHAARVPGPYVLVGHSMGGLFIRLYSAMYPEEVSGLVLVDALAEQSKPLFKPGDWTTFVGLNSGTLPGFENYTALETIDFDASFQQMERELNNGPMEKIPAVILVRGLPVELPPTAPPKFASVLEPAWRKSEEQLALAVPHIQYVIARKSRHYIQWDEPGLVVQAIRTVVARVAR
ncbi:MAG: alpha/beta hydrolase [Candidatus Acidiferrum sp.]